MVKQKLIFYIFFLLNVSLLEAVPITISPHISFDVYPKKSEVTKLLLNENYDEKELQKFKIGDTYINISLSGFNCAYYFKNSKNKIKNNYARLNYSLELVSHNNSKFSGKIKKIEIHSGNNVTVINDDIIFENMNNNVYNNNYYSCMTKSSKVEFVLSPSNTIYFVVYFQIDDQEYIIEQEYQIIKKKHFIELND